MMLKNSLLVLLVMLVSFNALAVVVEPTDLSTLATKYSRGVTSEQTYQGSADSCFDGVLDANPWLGYKAKGPSLSVRFFDGSPVVNAYAITIHARSGKSFDASLAPKSWKFYGAKSPDDAWVLLDERQNQTGWTASPDNAKVGAPRVYCFTNSTHYSCYKFVPLANNGAEYVAISEIALLQAEDTEAFVVSSDISRLVREDVIPYDGFVGLKSGETVEFDLDSTVYVDPMTSARYTLNGWELVGCGGTVLDSGMGNDGLHPFSYTANGDFAQLNLHWIDERAAFRSSRTDLKVSTAGCTFTSAATTYGSHTPALAFDGSGSTYWGVNSGYESTWIQCQFAGKTPVIDGIVFQPKGSVSSYRLFASLTGAEDDWTELVDGSLAATTFAARSDAGVAVYFDNVSGYAFYRLYVYGITSQSGFYDIAFLSSKKDGVLEVYGSPRAYGLPQPLYGLQDGLVEGQAIPCEAPPSTVAVSDDELVSCIGAEVRTSESCVTNQEVAFDLAFPGTYTKLTWLWVAEYRQVFVAQGAGRVDISETWSARGDEVRVTATPTDDDASFVCWMGDLPDGCLSTDNPLVYRAEAPCRLTAAFSAPVYVKPAAEGGSDENDGSSWDGAFATVAAAFKAGAMKIRLAPGEYLVEGDTLELGTGVTLEGNGDPAMTVLHVDAEYPGAVLRVTGQNAMVRNLTLEGGTSSDGYAAGLVMTAGVASNLVVRGNAAHGENSKGGGVYVSSGAVFSDSVVSNNTCTGSGGGLYADGSLDLSRCLVAGNRSTGPGGGLYACAKVNVTGCTFADNAASNGGGVQFSGAEGSRISFSHLVGNSATSYGGGIGIQDAAVSVSDCLIQKNTASYRGGGIDGYGASGSTVDRCVIDSNSASSEGGGVISDNVKVRNCLVVSNRTYVAGGGGGVYSHKGVTIENCTIADNNSGVEGSTSATIRNSIIWRNGSKNLSANATISDSCIGGYSGAGTRVIADDPKLTKDFHLKASSPCVNKGANLNYTADSLDLARQPRIHVFEKQKYNVCDMGCYESPYSGPTGLVIFFQ